MYWDPRTRVVVVLLDTRYLDPAISELHAGGYEVQDEDGTRLS
ncbi:MAG: transposase [Actinomycetota bacterium]|nr:transposase [Actinomycetota bacterium]